jgi:hypothetical protein
VINFYNGVFRRHLCSSKKFPYLIICSTLFFVSCRVLPYSPTNNLIGEDEKDVKRKELTGKNVVVGV